MFKRITIALIIGLLVVVGFGCAKKSDTPQTGQTSSQTQVPPGHPSTAAPSGQSAKPVDVKQVTDKITKDIDAKFAGDWSVSGTTLKKGTYTENNSYKITDEVTTLYQGSMVSIFAGPERVSSSVRVNGKVSTAAEYPIPDTVAKVMQSGETTQTPGDSGYQKVFLPLKDKDGKTVAVMSVSLAP